MDVDKSSVQRILFPNLIKIDKKRQEFWNGTLVDNYNFLMSEELICHCKRSLEEPFCSLNDLAVHHVSYNEFEKQYVEITDWCEKISGIIKTISSNALTCYLRQQYYEELYEQGLMRLRMFNQYAKKLMERFPDLNVVIKNKLETIYKLWYDLEARFIGYLDEDFDRIVQDLHDELFLFEEWIINIEEQLERFDLRRNEKVSTSEDIQELMKLQDEIKSKNTRISTVIEICERLKSDYQQQNQQVPLDYASDLENRWHQIWIHSVEIQCKLEEQIKTVKHSASLPLIDDEDIIPFNSSEYEKISLTSLNDTSSDYANSLLINRKRSRSANSNRHTSPKRKMMKSKRRMSLNVLPKLFPLTYYYSLTNINDYDDRLRRKRQKKTSSKLDIGYASQDDYDRKPIRRSQSDSRIRAVTSKAMKSPLTQSLPSLNRGKPLPKWSRYSTTSAYDTCSNPDIDLSVEDRRQKKPKPSLLMYSKKYTKIKRYVQNNKPTLTSNSYDASTEYTDPDQSENDMDNLSSNLALFSSSSSSHNAYQNSDSLFYNRYTTTTTTTTTTGYSSDIELETTTIPSENEEQPSLCSGKPSQVNSETFILSQSAAINEIESSNTLITIDKIESSEPCWDGYQNPLFYPINSHDLDSMETTLKWDDQFLELDQPYNSTSADEVYIKDRAYARTNNTSSLSLITSVINNKQQLDSDSDLDDFNYVINESEKQLLKTRLSLEKKRRQQELITNDRHQRKYDEILRTCETNIQCLQRILRNLHRSNNSRLNNIQAIEILLKYLSDWNDMRQQITNDRTRARHLLPISQEIIKLKLRIDNELSHINTSLNYMRLDNKSLNQLKTQISYEINQERESRQKLISLYNDLHLTEEHLKEYRMAYPSVSLSYHIDEHISNNRRALEQFTNRMDSYRTQLHSLLTMIDNILPVENLIEQKLASIDYPIEYQELQALIDNYERMMPMNSSHMIVKNHCEYKLDIYRKMFYDLMHKQDKHVSFDNQINFNNNNSTTTQEQYVNSANDNFQKTKIVSNQYKQTDARAIQHNAASDHSSNKNNRTSSYISDDCKVLYIETVIEVPKPVYYEHSTDTLSVVNTEYHHQTNPQSRTNMTLLNKNKFFMDTNLKGDQGDSSDDDLINQHNNVKSMHLPTTLSRQQYRNDSLRQNIDSGIELDQTSSSSTIYNQPTSNDRLLFPPSNTNFDQISSQPTLVRRLHEQTVTKHEEFLPSGRESRSTHSTSPARPTLWDRFKQQWRSSLFIGLFILFLLFLVYLFGLDCCSRSRLIKTIEQAIIRIENEGLPTI